ncbi:hypothetical protein MRB53_020404 [Persea americana]|uniref:Uncharacterized protein n=1 Tax=Persea americana TaxID=3435 RepID=A0ACC2L152_PERAE|nr:hypothetical protein MRB53_020404 [Persea americana]
MADLLHDTSSPPPSPRPPSPSFIKRLLGKRRTWVLLFVLVYALLLSSSWNLLRSILSWYSTTTAATTTIGWPALYASVLFGAVFGLLSMITALAIAVPATVVTWITVLVLLAFAGRKRQSLVADGRKITADIAGSTMKIVLKEGNLVAAACAILSYLALTRSREED